MYDLFGFIFTPVVYLFLYFILVLRNNSNEPKNGRACWSYDNGRKSNELDNKTEGPQRRTSAGWTICLPSSLLCFMWLWIEQHHRWIIFKWVFFFHVVHFYSWDFTDRRALYGGFELLKFILGTEAEGFYNGTSIQGIEAKLSWMEIGLGFDDNQQAKEIDIFLFCLGNIYIFILPQNLLQSKQLHNALKKTW